MTIEFDTSSETRSWTSKETCYKGHYWNNMDSGLDNIIVPMSKFPNVMIVLSLYERMFLFLKDTGGVRGQRDVISANYSQMIYH